jgi:hypothetical protein
MRIGKIRAVLTVCLAALWVSGCSSGKGGDDGGVDVPDEVERFAEAFAQKVCGLYAQCGCLPEVEEEFCRYRVAAAAAGFLVSDWLADAQFHEDCTQSILDAVEVYGCSIHLLSWERLATGEACAGFCSLLSGPAPAGGDCRGESLYHYPLSDCAEGLLCDGSGKCVDPCQSWFSDKLAEGGQCERGWEVVGECADGLVCDSSASDTCLPLPGLDQTCLYDRCLPGLYCEIIVTTKTCRAQKADGEPCHDHDECYSNVCESDACSGGAAPAPAVCEYVREILEIDDPGLPDVSIADLTLSEGDSGTTEFVFGVQLSKPADREVSVDIKTVDGTARSSAAGPIPADFAAAEETLVIPAGETGRDFVVLVNGDAFNEDDETFQVELSNPVFVNIAAGSATGSIQNDDPLPRLSIADVTMPEGQEWRTFVDFQVELSQPSARNVSVSWETHDGTAVSMGALDLDYRRASGELTLPPSETQGLLQVQVHGEEIFEPDETFYVDLFDPVNAEIEDGRADCTLQNDDSIPEISVQDVSHLEGDLGTTPYLFWIQLSRPSSQPVSVDVQTAGVSAAPGGDFTAVSRTVHLEPGQESLPVIVLVSGDQDPEGDETFELLLSNPQNAGLAGDRAVGTIGGDDSGSIVYVDAAAAGAGDGSSWADAFTHLHYGLEAAVAGDRVWVAAGTYRSAMFESRNGAFTLKEGVAVYGGFAGGETSLSQRDWRANPTVLTGDMESGERAYNVVSAVDVDLVILDGFHITRGAADGEEYNLPQRGGGLEVIRSSPRVSHCVFRDNLALAGGAVYSHGRPVFQDCSFYKNSAIDRSSGAMNTSAAARTALLGCLFTGNYANSAGGALAGDGFFVKDCIFAANRAGDDGGAMYIGSSLVTNCLIVGNQARDGTAGGVQIDWKSRMTNCTISGNVGDDSGGVYADGSLAVTNCILWGNFRWDADLVADELSVLPEATVTVTHTDVYAGWDGSAVNVYELGALSDGGGNLDADPLFLGGGTGTWTAQYQYDEPTQRTTLTDDTAAWTQDLRGKFLNPDTLGESQYRIVNLQFLIVDNTETTITVLGFAMGSAGDSYQIHDHHLQPQSPCIDAGTSPGAPQNDLEGTPRDTTPDLGAYEAQ